jgi:Tripartite tricarboxylate transporter family receptor
LPAEDVLYCYVRVKLRREPDNQGYLIVELVPRIFNLHLRRYFVLSQLIACTALPPALANIQDGKLHVLAVLAVKRSAEIPNVPTMQEAGYLD